MHRVCFGAHRLGQGSRGSEKFPGCFWNHKAQFQSLRSEAERNGQKAQIRCAVAGINNLAADLRGFAGKSHSLEAPVRHVKNFTGSSRAWGQVITAIISTRQKELHSAVSTGKQPVRFLEDHRSTALWAIMVNLPTRFVHRIDCNKWNLLGFQFHSEDISALVAPLRSAARIEGRRECRR
jgi:hypothetical protein